MKMVKAIGKKKSMPATALPFALIIFFSTARIHWNASKGNKPFIPRPAVSTRVIIAEKSAEPADRVATAEPDDAVAALANCKLRPRGPGERIWWGVYTSEVGGTAVDDDDNRSFNVSFVTIPKSGSSTLRAYTEQVLNGTGTRYHTSKRPLPTDAFHVAFVRSPVDRFVSSYMELYSRQYVPAFADRQDDFDAFFDAYANGSSPSNCSIPDHFRAQVQHLTDEDGRGLRLDYVGRVERMDEEWNGTLA